MSGVGEGVSTVLSFRRAVERYYRIRKDASGEPLDTLDKYGRYLSHRFADARNDVVYILCLDSKCKPISCMFVGEGNVNSANVPIRRVVEMSLAANATSVILAHNHPGGIALPSNEDIQTTLRLANALRSVDIELADHLIFADSDYISLAVSNYY